jgi:uncharacterized protein YdiU (UPF0061 family)
VLNSDNMNITGESFDYGPWRFLPKWDPNFTAAYFDETGLYAYGRQAVSIHWNCAQLALALRSISEAPPLVAALERFAPLYEAALTRRFCWRLGVKPRDAELDRRLVSRSEKLMEMGGIGPDAFFFAHRGGRNAEGVLAETLEGYELVADDHPFWADPVPQSMLIDEVEAIWSAIAERDDWQPLHAKVAALRRMGEALGEPPPPEGHLPG